MQTVSSTMENITTAIKEKLGMQEEVAKGWDTVNAPIIKSLSDIAKTTHLDKGYVDFINLVCAHSFAYSVIFSKKPCLQCSYTFFAQGGQAITVAHLQPGFHFKEHAAPRLGVTTCGRKHVGYVVKGSLRIKFETGVEAVVREGEVRKQR